MKRNEIAEFRGRLGMNKSEFGRLFGVGGTQIDRWEKGNSKPTAARMKSIEKLDKEHSSGLLIKENVVLYDKAGDMGQKNPYNEEVRRKSTREIADEAYYLLSPERKSKIDAEYAALVMREYAEEEYIINNPNKGE